MSQAEAASGELAEDRTGLNRQHLLRALVAAPLVLLLGSLLIWPATNRVTTAGTRGYPEIKPLESTRTPAQLTAALQAFAQARPRWTLVSSDAGGLQHALEARTRVGFVDDVKVRIEPRSGGARVHAESASRLGKLDFGQNARNLRELLAALAR